MNDGLERFRLPLRASIYEPGDAVEYVYFPIDAVISVVTVMRDGGQIEVLTIGREGVAGARALLDATAVSQLTFCQVGGEAYRMKFERFAELCGGWIALRTLVRRYLSAQIDVMAQSIACNRLHYVNERCARWILMTHDRVGRDEFQLTHESLATMLGVRRAGVSVAAAKLQHAGAIRYSRGRFTVVDRHALERESCECYFAINDSYKRRRLPAA
jgi:CRP-like cAMP-binding protein